MPPATHRAITLAHATANRLAGITVIYRRPATAQQAELVGYIGTQRVERGDAEGAVIRDSLRDYIFGTNDLVFGDGVPFLPQDGDQIHEAVGEKTFVMEVRPPVSDGKSPTSNGKSWAWHGPAHDAVRVHARQIATE